MLDFVRRRRRSAPAHGPARSRGLSIRAAVIVGFTLTLALWLALAIGVVQRLTDVETRTRELESKFSRADDLLTIVRTETLLGSVYVRDALLDVPENAEYYRRRLQDSRGAVEQALAKYLGSRDAGERTATVARLKAEVDDFWETLMPALSWDPERRALQTRTLLRTRVLPRRQKIIAISDEIQQLNRLALLDQQRQASALYAAMRRRMWQTAGVVLAIGMAVAFLVIRHSGRQERRIEAQRTREQESAQSLQRLSAKLVRAQEQERRTIARELHDEIGQALTAIKVELAIVARELRPDAPQDLLADVRSITDHAIQAARDLSHLLHPPLLDDLGLPATIEWYLRSFSTRHAIRAELVHEGFEQRLSPEIEVCLYRVVQEALTNVARHSRATQCRVYLQRLPRTVLLTIEDDGSGFDVPAVTTRQDRRGLGLLGIRERAVDFGGEFRVESAPGGGTRLTVELPAWAHRPEEGTEEPPGAGPAVPSSEEV